MPNANGAPLLVGKVAFVTGAARGIGLAVARCFAAHGAAVAVADLAADEAGAAAAGLAEDGRAVAVPVDVTDEAGLAAALARTVDAFGRVDCVVANAGILLLRHVVDTPLEDWRRVLEVNLTGAFLTCKVFARHMIEEGAGGRIILTASLFGLRGGAENGAYAASKFGVVGLTECLAAELAPHGIRVNAVCPGQIDTDMLQQLSRDRARMTGQSAAQVRQALERRVPLGRLGGMDELAGTYLYLASELSGYVTGQAIAVDGGWRVG